jgi:predicted Zn-dependent protease
MDVGAYVGGRAYAQSYELEADTLGAYVTARAGYSPERGADIFGRPSLANPGGPAILASHPGSAQRQATVARVAADIRRQQAAGLVPRPGTAG